MWPGGSGGIWIRLSLMGLCLLLKLCGAIVQVMWQTRYPQICWCLAQQWFIRKQWMPICLPSLSPALCCCFLEWEKIVLEAFQKQLRHWMLLGVSFVACHAACLLTLLWSSSSGCGWTIGLEMNAGSFDKVVSCAGLVPLGTPCKVWGQGRLSCSFALDQTCFKR